MDDYAGRVLADRYRLPLPPADAYDLVETRAFDTYSGQEVRIRQVPLPEVVDAELVGDEPYTAPGRATRRPADPGVRRALEAAQAAAQIPDHPRLDQVFDVFAEAGSLWIVSEFVAATPLSELLAEAPLSPYRAAEIGSDLLTALRALHAHGWTHRNVTPRTVLVCEDGRVVLTGLAAGAAEEALCGYAPVPFPDEEELSFGPRPTAEEPEDDGYEPEFHEAEEIVSGDQRAELYGPGAGHGSGAWEPVPAYEPERVPGVLEASYAAEEASYRTDEASYATDESDYRPEYQAGPLDAPRAEPRDEPLDELQAGPQDEFDAGRDHAQDRTRDPQGFYGPDPAGTPYGPAAGPGRSDGAGARPESPAAPGVPVPGTPSAADVRAARAGAIAAYRAGAR
ncbi:protein kinase, partial [Streptomyces showdoensis]